MDLYIMRHGIAAERFEWSGDDFSRPLTEKGRLRTREVCLAIEKKFKPDAEIILSSPLVRARQTAEIASAIFDTPLKICDELACGAGIGELQTVLAYFPQHKNVLLVGHEPDCGYIIGRLLGNYGQPLKKAGMAYLSGKPEPGKMKLKWLLRPRDLVKTDGAAID